MINEVINSYWLLAGFLSIPPLVAFFKKKDAKISEFLFTYFFTFVIGLILKRITAVPRPFANNPQVLGITSNIPITFSFPSLHAALITVFAWALSTIIPELSWLGFAIALFMATSRVYLGVHYYFDIVAGFLIGTGVFWIIYLLFNPDKILPKKTDPNVRRKLFHLVYGISLAALIHYDLINIYQLGLTTFVFGAFVLGSRYLRPKRSSRFILYFERKKKPKYLGVGPFFFLVSSFVTTLVFNENIAVAAVLNLAIGDSVNALLGHFWKDKGLIAKLTKKNELEPKKRLEASFAAAISTIIVALNYVTPIQAIAGAFVTLGLEFSEPRFRGKKIDDNLIIPAASGLLMSLI